MKKISFALVIIFVFLLILQPNILASENESLSLGRKPKVFVSPFDQNALENKYKELLTGKGYTYRKDKDIRIGKMRRLRFDKGNRALEVAFLSLGDKGTRVTLSHSNIEEGVLGFKDTIPSIKKLSDMEFPDYRKKENLKKDSFKPSLKTKIVYFTEYEVPVPPEAKALEQIPPQELVGADGKAKAYYSQMSLKKLEDFYRRALRRDGFEEIKNKNFKILTFKRLRFEREDMAIEVYFSQEEEGCNIIAVKYPDKNGASRIESDPLSGVSLPREDDPLTSDVKQIPRPPGSVRLSGELLRGSYKITYTAPSNVSVTADFYRRKMVSLGWVPQNDINLRQADSMYSRNRQGRSFIPQVPVGNNIDLGEVLKNSFILNYKSDDESSAVIMIYPDFVNNSTGSMVEVTYTNKKGGY